MIIPDSKGIPGKSTLKSVTKKESQLKIYYLQKQMHRDCFSELNYAKLKLLGKGIPAKHIVN